MRVSRILPIKICLRIGVSLYGALTLIALGCCAQEIHSPRSVRSAFIGITNFSSFGQTTDDASLEVVLTSRTLSAVGKMGSCSWNELIVSWNASTNVYLRTEARVIFPDHTTKYYSLGDWSYDATPRPRASSTAQTDDDGSVKIDTLVMKHPGGEVQLRISLGSTDTNITPNLKYLGLSFCDNEFHPLPLAAPLGARGKILDVPQFRQAQYGDEGWCSPASLAMVLNFWGNELHRPDLNRTVPEVAAATYDSNYHGTGNWPFNTAYAGSFPGMRAYVRRVDDLAELEDWIAAGIPTILSVSSYLINNRHDGPDNGHLIVCLGFTKNGDVVVNDPGVSVKRNESARRIYPRQRVIEAWKKSKNTAYFIYPEKAIVPTNQFSR